MEKDSFKEKIEEAIKNAGERKFKQSLELIFNFKGLKMDQPDNKLNVNLILPKGRGKDVEIGVFADGDLNLQAKKVSKYVLNRKELEDYAKSKRKMRVLASKCYGFIAQADLMGQVGKNWGVVLAPRGKMPQPVPGNAPVEPIMQRVKNTVRIRSKKLPTVQVPFGTVDMNVTDLVENAYVVYESITKKIVSENITSIYIKASMGKPIKVK